MNVKEWMNLKIINLDDPQEKRILKKGDKFLFGKNMAAQKENKKKGDEIWYFRVIKKKKNNIEYVMESQKLEV